MNVAYASFHAPSFYDEFGSEKNYKFRVYIHVKEKARDNYIMRRDERDEKCMQYFGWKS